MVWKLDHEKMPTSDFTKPEVSLETSGKVLGVSFHPFVPHVLLSYSMGMGACDMRVWNLGEGGGETTEEREPEVFIDVHGEGEIMNVSWNENGTRIVTTAKDKKARVIDPRKNVVVHEVAIQEAERECWAYFLSETTIATIGFAKGNARQIGVYDIKSNKCLQEMEVEGDSGAMLPHLDADTGVLYVASSGSPTVQMFHFPKKGGGTNEGNTNEKYVERLGTYKSKTDFKGFAVADKIFADVKKVEVNKAWHLGKDRMIPISFTLPRKRVEFFQDDIFLPTASNQPIMTAEEWFKGEKDCEVTYVSLQPKGMVPLSQAPEEKLTERQIKYVQKKKAMVAPKAKGCLGHESAKEVRQHFQDLADLMDTAANPWDAGGDQEDSDWSD